MIRKELSRMKYSIMIMIFDVDNIINDMHMEKTLSYNET